MGRSQKAAEDNEAALSTKKLDLIELAYILDGIPHRRRYPSATVPIVSSVHTRRQCAPVGFERITEIGCTENGSPRYHSGYGTAFGLVKRSSAL